MAQRGLLQNSYGPAFDKAGISYEVLERDEPGAKTVRLATMHRVKGLEYPVVFVVGAKQGVIPLETPLLSSDDAVVARLAELQERCLLYVASSRARDLLYVTCSGIPSSFLQGMDKGFHEVPSGDPPKARAVKKPSERPPAAAGPLEPEQLAERLAKPLSKLALPARIYSWADRVSATTLGDLAKVPPLTLAQERHMGRLTVAKARAVIERQLGMRWEEYCRSLRPEEEDAEVELSSATPWSALASALPVELLSTPPGQLALPTRMLNHCQRAGIGTLGELVKVPAAELVATENLGRTSVNKTRQAIIDFVDSVEERRAIWDRGLMESLKAHLQELESIPRMILTRRSGLGSQQETLESIAVTLGVTRERVRQIEKKSLKEIGRRADWLKYVQARFEEVASDGVIVLDALRSESWWQGAEDKIEALDYFCERMFEGGWRVITIEGEDMLATADPRAVEAAGEECARVARKAKTPVAVAELKAGCDAVCSKLPMPLRAMLWEQTLEQLNLDETGHTVVSVGKTKRAQIMAALQAAAGPMPVADLMRQVGRCSLPDEVLVLGRGLVGLNEHFPDFDTWQAKLVPAVARILQNDGPDRQWLCSEILEELREEQDLPEWFGDWHLASVLRNVDAVAYLGRLRVALPGVADESGRIFIHEQLEKILSEHGEPMEHDALLAELRRSTDFNEPSAVLRLLRPPFLKCSRSTWGLLGRDLLGGVAAMTEALDELETVLSRRERGLSATQAQREVAKLSKSHAEWTPEMCQSVTRADPRFRLSISGNIGLADWESVRVPTRAEIVKQSLEEGEGRVSLEAVRDRIAATYGVAPERISLGQMANRFGAVLDGEWLVGGAAS